MMRGIYPTFLLVKPGVILILLPTVASGHDDISSKPLSVFTFGLFGHFRDAAETLFSLPLWMCHSYTDIIPADEPHLYTCEWEQSQNDPSDGTIKMS